VLTPDGDSEGVELAGRDARTIAGDSSAAARATAVMMASRLVIAALGWIGTVVVARTLSPDEWGQFSFVFILLSLMAVFTDLGVGRVVLSRLIGTDPDDIALTASAFVALRVLLGFLGYGIALGYVLLLGYPAEVIGATAIGGLVVILATPSHALSVLYQSRHRLTLVAVAESLGQVIQLALTVAAALFAPLLLVFVIPPVVNQVVALAIKTRGVYGKVLGVPRPGRVEFRRWGPMLKEAVPLAIGFALTIAMSKIDVLILSRLDTFDSVGLYSIGYKFSDLMDTVTLAAVAPISTLLVAAWPDDPDVFRKRTRDGAVAFALIGGVAITAFWPSADRLIGLLYGERFMAADFASRLLVVGGALTSLLILGVFLLAAAGKQRYYPVVALLGLALNVGANLVLIPRMSFNGAAIATVGTLIVMLVALWTLIAVTVPVASLLPVGHLVGLAALTAVIAAAGQLAVARTAIPWPVVSVVAVLMFMGLAVLFRLTGGLPLPLPKRIGRR
jgi:O-antigen/teichoic acid export membrane protein